MINWLFCCGQDGAKKTLEKEETADLSQPLKPKTLDEGIGQMKQYDQFAGDDQFAKLMNSAAKNSRNPDVSAQPFSFTGVGFDREYDNMMAAEYQFGRASNIDPSIAASAMGAEDFDYIPADDNTKLKNKRNRAITHTCTVAAGAPQHRTMPPPECRKY